MAGACCVARTSRIGVTGDWSRNISNRNGPRSRSCIFDPRHPTKADRLAEALGAIGVGVSVGVYDAASRAKAA
jgi:hypothetical protein